MPDLLTIDEAAEYFRVRPGTIKRLKSRGALPFRKVGRVWMVSRDDLDAYLDRPAEPKAPALPPRFTLYRFFAKDGLLLYVGITGTGVNRWTQHSKNQLWWLEVAWVTVEHFGSLAEVAAAELAAIASERPKYNVRHQPR